MINKKMTVNDVVDTVEKFIAQYISSEHRTDEKYELEKTLPKISNKAAKDVIQKEIDNIKREENEICDNHQKLIQELVDYVFTNNFRKNMLIVETYFDTQSYRNSDGGYDDFFYFVFSGQLGKPLYDLMTLSSLYEFWAVGKTVPKDNKLTNTMSRETFVSVVNRFYIAEGEPLV